MRTRPPVTNWANDFDHLDPAWVDNPYPIGDELRQKCPMLILIGSWAYISFRGTRPFAPSPQDTEHFPRAAASCAKAGAGEAPADLLSNAGDHLHIAG